MRRPVVFLLLKDLEAFLEVQLFVSDYRFAD